MAHVPLRAAGFLHDLIPFLDQAFVKEVLEVLKSGIYVSFCLLLGLVNVLLKLLAMGASMHVKSIILLKETDERRAGKLVVVHGSTSVVAEESETIICLNILILKWQLLKDRKHHILCQQI